MYAVHEEAQKPGRALQLFGDAAAGLHPNEITYIADQGRQPNVFTYSPMIIACGKYKLPEKTVQLLMRCSSKKTLRGVRLQGLRPGGQSRMAEWALRFPTVPR